MSYRIARTLLIAGILACLFATPLRAQAQPDAPKKRVLLLTQSQGWVHEAVKRKDGKPNLVEQTFQQLAERTKLFDVEPTQDCSIITADKLKNVDLIVFYTTGDLPMSEAQMSALDQWQKDGGLFMGIHPATDTFKDHPVYSKMIGGAFESHPWVEGTTVTIKVLDPDHAASKPWGAGDTFKEEIYMHKNFDPASVRVIIALDMEKTAVKRPRFIPITWIKEYGKGKVFYTSLGHRPDMWTNPKYQDHLVGGMRWLFGLETATVTPNPEVSAKEEEIAKKAASAPRAP